MSRLDATVAFGFVLAAFAEAVVRDQGMSGLLVFNATGALWLGSLAVRRQRPVVTISVIAAAGGVGSFLTALMWPEAADGGGVWILAMMLASYSLGAHAAGRVVVLGVLLPLLVVVVSDLTTMSGWARINGIVFVGTFIGLLPTAVGGLVRIRHERLRTLRDQQERIVRAQRAQQESAVLAERLRNTERLQPTLVEGLQALAAAAEAADDPGEIEAGARNLLTRTREEVVTLTAPVEESPVPAQPVADPVHALREAAQPWAVIAAGALVAGLSLETTNAMAPSTPWWLAVLGAIAVGAPLVLAWRWPVLTVALAWVAATAYSHLITPLDGSLSESAFALAAAFVVAALPRRRAAVLGLAVCWLGQLLGVSTSDRVAEGALLLLCWLGGLAVNEVSRLVEQTRTNNELLARQEATAASQAVVEERLRLARDLHDSIGHSLTVVALQAGAARRLAGTDPDRSREVMRTVAAVARDGVAALAPDEGMDGSTADIASLVERTRATGLVVDADLTDVALLDPVQRVVAFRVVQEALTNVLRHAPGSLATVAVRRRDSGVEVIVTNSAPASAGAGPGTGLGLAGIRERVAAGAGQVTWGPGADGGFEVRALLPSDELADVAR